MDFTCHSQFSPHFFEKYFSHRHKDFFVNLEHHPQPLRIGRLQNNLDPILHFYVSHPTLICQRENMNAANILSKKGQQSPIQETWATQGSWDLRLSAVSSQPRPDSGVSCLQIALMMMC